jgi:PAS domain S-box-containing protein
MFVNARMAEMLAYPLSRVTARPILDFVFDEDKAAMASILEARRRSGFDIFEFRFRRNDGAPLPCTVSMQPIFDPEGAYLGCLLMLTDISDRVEQREELVKERQEVCHWVGQIHAGLDEIVGELRAASYGTAESPDPLGRQIDRLSELAEMSRETTQRLASETSDGSTNPAFRSNPLDGCAPSSHR